MSWSLIIPVLIWMVTQPCASVERALPALVAQAIPTSVRRTNLLQRFTEAPSSSEEDVMSEVYPVDACGIPIVPMNPGYEGDPNARGLACTRRQPSTFALVSSTPPTPTKTNATLLRLTVHEDSASGEQGAPGLEGAPGQDGAPGQSGATSSEVFASGEDGKPGPDRAGYVKSTNAGAYSAFSVLTRWGMPTCKSGMPIYSGFAVGKHEAKSNYARGGNNLLCYPSSEDWQLPSSGDSYSDNILSPVKYKLDGDTSVFHGTREGRIIPCAVCGVTARATIMIPGRKDCFPDWDMEYRGYILSGWSGNNYHPAPSEHLCIDEGALPAAGGTADNDGPLFSFVRSGACKQGQVCEGFNNKKVHCVVCSMA